MSTTKDESEPEQAKRPAEAEITWKTRVPATRLGVVLRKVGIPRISLRARLTAYSTFLVVLVMIPVILVVELRTRRILINQTRLESLAVAQSLAATTAAPLFTYRYADLQRAIDAAVSNDSSLVYVYVLDKDGQIAAYGREPGRQGTETADPFDREAAASRHSLTRPKSFRQGERLYEVLDTAYPIRVPGSTEICGTVRLGFSLDEMHHQTSFTRVALFGIGVLAILLGFGVTHVFAGRITRPIHVLVAGTRAVAKGRLDNKIDVDSNDEIGMLAENFNIMTETLEESYKRIQQWNRELEGKVEERTAELVAKTEQLELNQRNLEESQGKLTYLMEFHRNILDSVNEGIFAIDRQFLVRSWSRAMERLLKVPREDAIGKEVERVLPGSDREEWMSRYRQIFSSGRPAVDPDYVLTDAEGNETANYVEMLPLKDGAGMIIGVTTLVRDITELKARQQQTVNSERLQALGELAGGVAHNFNNILGAILGRVQLMKLRSTEPAVQEGLSIIEKVASDGAITVRRIQDFSRVRTEQEFHPVRMAEIVADSLEITRGRWKDDAERSGTPFRVVTDCDPDVHVMGNPGELREVVTNIIFNALDAMSGGGELRISVSRSDDGGVIVKISDTGTGMDDDVMSRIFNPFFSTKGSRGTGLGLAVSFGIIKRHGGAIDVESELGRGSEFTITLPAGLPVPVTPAGPAAPAQPPGSARVLIVDDEAPIREVLSDIISLKGHTAQLAASGREGLESFRHQRFDVVITDLGMAGMSGYDLARQVRQIDEHVPIILVTGWGEQILDATAKENGINFVIAKPFQVDEVLKTISLALSR